MKHLFLYFFIFFTAHVFSQDIVINEIHASSSDWVELKNTTSSSIDISGYYLTNDINELQKWMIPSGTSIPANGYLAITDVQLSSGGKTVAFSHSDGSEIDRVTYPAISNGTSYGLLSDNSLSLMSPPSQGTENNDASAFKYLEGNLTINVPSGIYASPQTVELSNEGEGAIYYTLDGTTPDNSSLVYNSPIIIDDNTVLKTIIIKSSTEYSIVENRSYIIGASHDLPVVLITSDNSTINPGGKEDIDGRVEFKFIETDGTIALNQYADFKASGRTSQSQPQLNGKIKANAAYGDKDFDHKMFPNKSLDEFESFLLRNSSQDWSETHMRDAFVSRLLGQDNLADFPFEGYRPAVLYVNAKYQGIINVREDDDNDYIQHNFNLKKDEFVRVGRDLARYDFTTDRAELNTLIDFNNHVNINFLTKYAELNEWGMGTWRDLSGKTGYLNHYFNHDFDATFGLRGENHVPLTGPMSVSYLLPYEMTGHEPYKTEALQFVAATINHVYNTDRAIAILDAMEAEIESEIPAHGMVNTRLATEQGYPSNSVDNAPFANLAEWKNNVEALRTDIRGRIDVDIFNRLKNEYSVGAPIQVTYASSDISQGFIRVHNVKSVNETFTGTYFKDIPVQFSAEALPGYRFVRWEGDVTSTDVAITPTFTTNSSIRAVFEAVTTSLDDLVINEVQGKNDATIADENGEFDDWIEIYNPTDAAIDLAGYYISDNLSEPLKWKIPSTDPSKTTVPAKGFLLLWADKDLEQGENHVDFKLKGTDDVLLTTPDGGTLLQYVTFAGIEADESFGGTTDADETLITFMTPTPNATNVSVISAVNTNNTEDEVSIYPNPVDDNVTISTLTSEMVLETWSLYNTTGVEILSGTEETVNLEHLNKGVYVLIVNNTVSRKIIKN